MGQSIEVLSKELATNNNKMVAIQNQIVEATASLQTQLKTLQDKDQKVREAIKDAMEAYEVKKISNEHFDITYIAPSKRVGIDLDAIRTHHPDLAKKYEKVTNVKSSIRIKMK